MKMAKEKEVEKKTYKTPILYLHISRAGEHLYAFNIEKKDGSMVLGGEVESLILNVSEVSAVLEGRMEWAKVSVLLTKKGESVE